MIGRGAAFASDSQMLCLGLEHPSGVAAGTTVGLTGPGPARCLSPQMRTKWEHSGWTAPTVYRKLPYRLPTVCRRAAQVLGRGDPSIGDGQAVRGDLARIADIAAAIDAGAGIKVLDRSYIDLTTPMGRGFMAMMSALAEDERQRIIKRTHEGRQIARAKGVKMGRKPILTAHQMKEARQRLAKGEKTRDLAKSYRVSVSTISRLAA